MEGIEEPNKNDDVERWVEVDSDPLAALHVSNKDGSPTIAWMNNAELPNMQYFETKKGTVMLPMDDPDEKDSGGELAME